MWEKSDSGLFCRKRQGLTRHYDSEVEDSGEFTRVSPLKKMMRALTILSQLASTNDFYYFFREKSMLHTSYEIFLKP